MSESEHADLHRSPTTVPKIIWMFWHDGFDQATPLTQICIKSWERHNPNWSVRLITQKNLTDYIDPALCKDLLAMNITVQNQANIVRLLRIARHGGVWADADCFCTKDASA